MAGLPRADGVDDWRPCPAGPRHRARPDPGEAGVLKFCTLAEMTRLNGHPLEEMELFSGQQFGGLILKRVQATGGKRRLSVAAGFSLRHLGSEVELAQSPRPVRTRNTPLG